MANVREAFAAGAIAPDLGFFPGGPQAFSQAVHRRGSGDFIRALLKGADSSLHEAFVLGWASHIYVDCAVHPLINQVAAAVAGDRDLWHLRLEWGMDCLLLEERPELGQYRLGWDEGGVAQAFGAAALAFYPQEASATGLRHGQGQAARWLRRLPSVYLLCGAWWQPDRPLASALGRGARPAWRALGGLLAPFAACRDVAAVVATWRPEPKLADELKEKTLQAAAACAADWSNGFGDRPNLDLDTGEAQA